jgi:hypothetical protein
MNATENRALELLKEKARLIREDIELSNRLAATRLVVVEAQERIKDISYRVEDIENELFDIGEELIKWG